jgi:uncharacterized RDD family membrane protein YckC
MLPRFIAFIIDLLLIAGVVSAFLFVTMGPVPEEMRTSQEGQTSIADKYYFFAYVEPLRDPALWGDSTFLRSVIPSMFKEFPAEMLLGCFVIPILFFALFDKLFGGSIGKLLTGIRVRKKEGGNISWGQALSRAIGKLISILIVFVGCIIALFDKKNQALHDKIANTLVVKK